MFNNGKKFRYGNWKTEGTNKAGYQFLKYFHFDDFRYPKVSSKNPTVSLWLADVGPPGRNIFLLIINI